MKKIILFSLFVGAMVSFPRVGHAETLQVVETENLQRSIYTPFDFKSYPPKTYRGMILVRVDKIKGGYVGWYV